MLKQAMVLMVALVLTGSVSAQPRTERWVIDGNGGSFVELGSGQWVERSKEGKDVATYSETMRNQDFVEFKSSDGRGFIVRLYSTFNKARGSTDTEFKVIYQGMWVK